MLCPYNVHVIMIPLPFYSKLLTLQINIRYVNCLNVNYRYDEDMNKL